MKHASLARLALSISAALVGCGEAGPPYALVFDADASEAQIAAVMAGAEDWNEQVGTSVFVRHASVGARMCDTVYVHFEDLAARPFAIGVAETKGCYFEVRYRDDAVDDPSTIRHELGHTLGLSDVYDPSSVMHRTSTPWATRILAADARWVRERFGL